MTVAERVSVRLLQLERGLDRIRLNKRLGLGAFVRRTFDATVEDHLAAFAGNLTYSGFFAIFPFLLFVLFLLTLFEFTHLAEALLLRAQTTLPLPVYLLLHDQIVPLAQSRADAAIATGAVLALLLALWSISGVFRAIMDAMNVMYGVQETRPLWKIYTMSVVLSIAVIGLLLVSLALLIFGPWIGETAVALLGLGAELELVWLLLEWVALLFFSLLAFALIYYAAPNIARRFRLITPGSVLAWLAWLAFSLLFSHYVNEVDWFHATYGALAGIIILLLYLYYSAYILLLGAEVNRVLEAYTPKPGRRPALPPDREQPPR